MGGSSRGLIEVLTQADLEGLANGYEIIIIVIGLHEASVKEYLLGNVKPILIATYFIYIIIAQLAFV
jgi:hypothetical protein